MSNCGSLLKTTDADADPLCAGVSSMPIKARAIQIRAFQRNSGPRHGGKRLGSTWRAAGFTGD
jgi:hypothetical protein